MFTTTDVNYLSDLFPIPGYSRYMVNRKGQVYNKLSENFLKGSTNPEGYHSFRLTDDTGYTYTYGRHRLLCDVFKSEEKLLIKGFPIVNHENGVKGDDFLDNLTWTTYTGNAHHAGVNQLTNKCQPILVKDVFTGTVKRYSSIIDYARESGLSKDAVNWRIKSPEERVFPEGKQYRSLFSKGPWKKPKESDILKIGYSKGSPILARYVLTNEIKIYRTMTELALELKVSLSTLNEWFLKNSQPLVPGLIHLKKLNDVNQWRTIEDPFKEIELFSNSVKVAVTNSSNGVTLVFNSAKECAANMGISPTCLNHRLKSNGETVFKDGRMYKYLNK